MAINLLFRSHLSGSQVDDGRRSAHRGCPARLPPAAGIAGSPGSDFPPSDQPPVPNPWHARPGPSFCPSTAFQLQDSPMASLVSVRRPRATPGKGEAASTGSRLGPGERGSGPASRIAVRLSEPRQVSRSWPFPFPTCSRKNVLEGRIFLTTRRLSFLIFIRTFEDSSVKCRLFARTVLLPP